VLEVASGRRPSVDKRPGAALAAMTCALCMQVAGRCNCNTAELERTIAALAPRKE
jgi:hypothetical protein